ncbi:virulence protein RhuM/Fic/DOC family protein [Desulfonatronovibrio magnus]|uniref:virulence protein RhuM/Fic/DOC family protein n=1 Tax=Desulfonatronovibrio magnus TaxID=698827 RepID=UPI0006988EC1|nr:virulence protein RhuM/Fic/DOC family protein [Desulfonatronovibrio magnus]
MENRVEIYRESDGQTQIKVTFDQDTVWLDAHQVAQLFGVQRPAIVKHISNIYKSCELDKQATCSILEQVASDGKKRKMNLYNLDVIISVGYRVNSIRATQFRQWATKRLKDYLLHGYAINEKRLSQKHQEVRQLKDGIRILSRAIEEKAGDTDFEWLKLYASGLRLLDDYDQERLDTKGDTRAAVAYPSYEEYQAVIRQMRKDFGSQVFGQEQGPGFKSAVEHIRQGFGNQDLYPSFEEKAATLLYLIVKNHAFVDGNKLIAAASFLLFLQKKQSPDVHLEVC